MYVHKRKVSRYAHEYFYCHWMWRPWNLREREQRDRTKMRTLMPNTALEQTAADPLFGGLRKCTLAGFPQRGSNLDR